MLKCGPLGILPRIWTMWKLSLFLPQLRSEMLLADHQLHKSGGHSLKVSLYLLHAFWRLDWTRKQSATSSVMSDSLQPHGLYPPCSPVHGISQARVLEWVALPFSSGITPTRGSNIGPRIAGRFFTFWATREALVTRSPDEKMDESQRWKGAWPRVVAGLGSGWASLTPNPVLCHLSQVTLSVWDALRTGSVECGKEVGEGSVPPVLGTWTSRTKNDSVSVKSKIWSWAGLCLNPRCSSCLLSDFEKNCWILLNCGFPMCKWEL